MFPRTGMVLDYAAKDGLRFTGRSAVTSGSGHATGGRHAEKGGFSHTYPVRAIPAERKGNLLPTYNMPVAAR